MPALQIVQVPGLNSEFGIASMCPSELPELYSGVVIGGKGRRHKEQVAVWIEINGHDLVSLVVPDYLRDIGLHFIIRLKVQNFDFKNKFG
jgi:hypothetical protein